MDRHKLEPILRVIENVSSDGSAVQTAQGLIAQFVSVSGKVTDERAFRDAIAAAIVAARTEGREDGQ